MPFGNVRNLVSDHGSQLVLIIEQRQQSGVDVDRPVWKSKRVRNRITQRAKLPFNVFEFLVSDDRRSDTIQISVQVGFVKDNAFLFETLVEQFDFAEQVLVDLAKLELLVRKRLLERARLRRCDARRTRADGKGSKK